MRKDVIIGQRRAGLSERAVALQFLLPNVLADRNSEDFDDGQPYAIGRSFVGG